MTTQLSVLLAAMVLCGSAPAQRDIASRQGPTTRTFSAQAWSIKQARNQPQATALDDRFGRWFPGGLILGDSDGLDRDRASALVIRTSAEVRSLLLNQPRATSRTLRADRESAQGVVLGTLGRQILTAKLNLAYDRTVSRAELGRFTFGERAPQPLRTRSIERMVALADRVYSGEFGSMQTVREAARRTIDIDKDGRADLSVDQLAEALKSMNLSFSADHKLPAVLVPPAGEAGQDDESKGREGDEGASDEQGDLTDEERRRQAEEERRRREAEEAGGLSDEERRRRRAEEELRRREAEEAGGLSDEERRRRAEEERRRREVGDGDEATEREGPEVNRQSKAYREWEHETIKATEEYERELRKLKKEVDREGKPQKNEEKAASLREKYVEKLSKIDGMYTEKTGELPPERLDGSGDGKDDRPGRGKGREKGDDHPGRGKGREKGDDDREDDDDEEGERGGGEQKDKKKDKKNKDDDDRE